MRWICLLTVVSVGCFSEPPAVTDNNDDAGATAGTTAASTGVETPDDADEDSDDDDADEDSETGAPTTTTGDTTTGGRADTTDGTDGTDGTTGQPVMCNEIVLPLENTEFEFWPAAMMPAAWLAVGGVVSAVPGVDKGFALGMESSNVEPGWAISQTETPPDPFPPGTYTLMVDVRHAGGMPPTPRFTITVQDPNGGKPVVHNADLEGWQLSTRWHAVEAHHTIDHPSQDVIVAISGPDAAGNQLIDIDNVQVLFEPTCP